jgi:predicted dehydrogenase
MSHELDALCWLFGAPSRITGMAAHASSLEIDTEDVADFVLQFHGGFLGTLHVDYVRRPPGRSLEVVGEGGALRWEYHTARLWRYAPGNRQWWVEEGDPRFERNQMYLDELRHFASCVRGEIEQPLIDGEQGAGVLAIALAGLRSSATSRAIDLQAEGEPVISWLKSLG